MLLLLSQYPLGDLIPPITLCCFVQTQGVANALMCLGRSCTFQSLLLHWMLVKGPCISSNGLAAIYRDRAR